MPGDAARACALPGNRVSGDGALDGPFDRLADPGLGVRLAALRTAVALLRDPLADPSALSALTHTDFRALPRPRGAGAAAPGAAHSVATAVDDGAEAAPPRPTLTGVPSPSEPADDDRDDEITADMRAIVARAQAGDADAFGELYDRYVDLVYRYIYYRVGSQPLAEDLTSETFLRALRRITSFTWQGRDIGAWFVTIARNLIADHFKSGRYRMEIATADMLDADQAEDGPEGAVLDGITNVTLLEAVKQLGAEQQECIVLRFLQGLSVAETALAMGKNEGAIKALQYRAVRALGRLLPEDLL
jgi:RNA polymerase sigma-70 factor (ECF subfamily)